MQSSPAGVTRSMPKVKIAASKIVITRLFALNEVGLPTLHKGTQAKYKRHLFYKDMGLGISASYLSV